MNFFWFWKRPNLRWFWTRVGKWLHSGSLIYRYPISNLLQSNFSEVLHLFFGGVILGYGTYERLTLPETNSSPLKIGRAPKGKDRIPTIHFQVFSLAGFVSGRVDFQIYRLGVDESCQVEWLQKQLHAERSQSDVRRLEKNPGIC